MIEMMEGGIDKLEKDKRNPMGKFAIDKLDMFKKKLQNDDSVDEHIKGLFGNEGINLAKKKATTNSTSAARHNGSITRKRTIGEFKKPLRPIKPRDPNDYEVRGILYTDEENTPMKPKSNKKSVKKTKSFLVNMSRGDMDGSPKFRVNI